MPRLQGGSEGEPEKGFAHPFFHTDVKVTELLSKNVYGLRLLPAFGPRANPDAAPDKTTYVPYRKLDGSVDRSGHAIFSDWYFIVKGYKWLGNEGRGFLSPLNSYKREQRGVDPIYDCFLTAKNHSNPDYVRFTKGTDDDYAILPPPKRYAVMNGLVMVETQLENRLIVMTGGGMEDLKNLLNVYRPAFVTQPISAEFDKYLFGDVTDPYDALWAEAKATVINNAGMKTSCLWFGKKRDALDGAQKYPIDPRTAEGMAFLTGRYDIGDTTNVTKVSTAEEILEFLVSDGFLPYELIQEACGNSWQVPPDTARRHYSTPPAEDPNHMGQRPPQQPQQPQQQRATQPTAQQSYAPPSPSMPPAPGFRPQAPGAPPAGAPSPRSAPMAPPPPPPAPPSQMAMPVERYWMNGPSGVHKVGADAVRSAVALGGNPMIMKENQEGGWQLASVLGFTPPPPQMAPPPPQMAPPPPQMAPPPPQMAPPPPQMAPPPPQAYTPPAQMAPPTPQAPPPQAYTPPAQMAPPTPQAPPQGPVGFAPLSQDEMAEFAALQTAFGQNPSSMDASKYARFMSLSDRASAAQFQHP